MPLIIGVFEMFVFTGFTNEFYILMMFKGIEKTVKLTNRPGWKQLSNVDLNSTFKCAYTCLLAYTPINNILTSPHTGWSRELATITSCMVAYSLCLTGTPSLLFHCLLCFASFITPNAKAFLAYEAHTLDCISVIIHVQRMHLLLIRK